MHPNLRKVQPRAPTRNSAKKGSNRAAGLKDRQVPDLDSTILSPRFEQLTLNKSASINFNDSGFTSPKIVRVSHMFLPAANQRPRLQKARSGPALAYFNKRPVPRNFLLDSPKTMNILTRPF